MIGGLTRSGGLPGPPGRVTLSAGVTICHVNVLRWGNPPGRGSVHGKKAEKRNMYVLKLCTFLVVSWKKSLETATDTQGV